MTGMKLLRRKQVWMVLLLFCLGVLFFQSNSIGRLIHPIHYEEDIRISAAHFSIDPMLIAAIIRTESKFNPDLISSKNAMGLMQIMPETADWIIEQGGYHLQMREHVMRPEVNIEMGTWYVHWLQSRFKGQMSYRQSEKDLIAVIAAAYNAGHNKVGQWIRDSVWDGRYETRLDIPYGETRHYIKRVMYYYDKYTSFYVEEKH